MVPMILSVREFLLPHFLRSSCLVLKDLGLCQFIHLRFLGTNWQSAILCLRYHSSIVFNSLNLVGFRFPRSLHLAISRSLWRSHFSQYLMRLLVGKFHCHSLQTQIG